MISGSLAAKKGYWYIILSLRDETGKRRQKWLSTGLKSSGNKKLAEDILYEKRLEYTQITDMRNRSNGIFFDEYMIKWLSSRKEEIAATTYAGYKNYISSIVKYFQELKLPFCDVKSYHISEFIDSLFSKGLSATSVLHYYTIIHKAFEDAVNNELIAFNPADKVKRPKAEKFVTTPYTVEETQQLLQVLSGEKLRLVITIAAYTGMRRSELLGLKWKAINFSNNILNVYHAVKNTVDENGFAIKGENKLKRRASFRALPLIPQIKAVLLDEINQRYRGAPPNPEDYICVDEIGQVLKPDYVTAGFKKILNKNGLRPIRFHDLRHGCANMLIMARVPLIEVQQWLGHTNISTTADMYAHLTFDTKLRAAEVLSDALFSTKGGM